MTRGAVTRKIGAPAELATNGARPVSRSSALASPFMVCSMSNPNPLPATNGVWRTFDPFSPTAKWRATRVLAGKATWTSA